MKKLGKLIHSVESFHNINEYYEYRGRVYLYVTHIQTGKMYKRILDKNSYDRVKKYVWWWSDLRQELHTKDRSGTVFSILRAIFDVVRKATVTVVRVKGKPEDLSVSNFIVETSGALGGRARKTNNKWKYRGVWELDGKYYCRIMYNKKRTNHGPFNTPEEAARLYNHLAKKFHGKSAQLNEIKHT